MMPDFRTIHTGGAPVFPSLLGVIQSAHPGMEIVTVFGSTEAEPIAHIPWSDVSEADRQRMSEGKGLLVGKPVPATRLRIIPDQSGKPIAAMTGRALDNMTLATGETGEIIVTGDHVLQGYLHGKGDEENKIRAGSTTWHRTGDAARIDENGRVWLLGRCSAAIRKNNTTIYPFGIECAAMHQTGVARCAVILLNGKVTLLVQGKPDAHLETNLLRRLKPLGAERVLSTPNIPVDKRHNAKIDYHALLTAFDQWVEGGEQ